MNDQEIIKEIQSLYPEQYSNDKLDVLNSSLAKMSPVIKKALIEFLQTNSQLELNLLGYSVDNLAKDHGMNEVAAYLTLDWIIREPDKALESIKRGHDFVESSNN